MQLCWMELGSESWYHVLCIKALFFTFTTTSSHFYAEKFWLPLFFGFPKKSFYCFPPLHIHWVAHNKTPLDYYCSVVLELDVGTLNCMPFPVFYSLRKMWGSIVLPLQCMSFEHGNIDPKKERRMHNIYFLFLCCCIAFQDNMIV